MAIKLFKDGYQNRKELFGRINSVLAFAFTTLAINFILKVVNIYFILNFIVAPKALGLIALGVAVFGVGILEPVFRKKRVYFYISCLDFLLFAILRPGTPLFIIPMALTVVIGIFLLQFFQYLYRYTGRIYRNRLIVLIFCMSLVFIGVGFDYEVIRNVLPSIYLIYFGFISLILGLLGIYYAFYGINIINESGWQNAIEELFIVHQTTLKPLYHQDFCVTKNNKKNQENVDTLSGGIVGVDSILRTIVDPKSGPTKGVSFIEQQGKYLLIEHGQVVLLVLVVNKNLKSLRYYLQKIRDAWEMYYCTKPINWSNINEDAFGAMQPIIQQILQKEA